MVTKKVYQMDYANLCLRHDLKYIFFSFYKNATFAGKTVN